MLKYSIGERVWCKVGYVRSEAKKCIIYDEWSASKYNIMVHRDKFLIINALNNTKLYGNHYLLLIENPSYYSCSPEDLSFFYNSHYEVMEEKYKKSRCWGIREEFILEKVIEERYGGKCKVCGDHNPYALVDEKQMFTCYRCSA